MLLLRSIKTAQKSEPLFFCKYINNIRFLSKESAVFKNDIEAFTRRFSKPLSTKELKRLSDNFLQSLFTGVVNKSMFEYPTVLRAADNNIVLDHSAEVESFLQNIPKDQFSEDTLEELRKLELFGLSIPQKYGGAGYSETECKFLQECIGGHSKIRRFLGYNENFGCNILKLYGNEEQKQKYLPRLAQGKSFISLAYLESGPLIDLSNIEGSAIYDELNNRYILSAEKKWVHNADKADLFLLAVKLPKLLDAEEKVFLQLCFFIVERDAPGLKIHKLKSTYAQENTLFDVSFKEVVVQQENLLGNVNTDGYNIIKTALSYNNVTDAAFCCNVIKQVAYNAMQFIQEGNLHDVSVRGYTHSHENMVSLTIYLYALESVIYFITGRFDTYENPDLFHESIFAKTLAVDILRIAIKKYTEILGRESFKSSELLEEAIKTMQYYTVFDDNIEYFKMMAGGDGLVSAAKKLHRTIKKVKDPFNNNFEAFKWHILPRRQKYNFRLELHETLSSSADILEKNFKDFLTTLENFLAEQGKHSLNNEHAVVKFAEIATYLYALIVSLARASSSICYDFHNSNNELYMASAFAYIAEGKIKAIIAQEIEYDNLSLYFRELGKEVFNRKEYPVEHPLTRTY